MKKLTYGDLRERFLYGDMTINPGRKSMPFTPKDERCSDPNPPGCSGIRNPHRVHAAQTSSQEVCAASGISKRHREQLMRHPRTVFTRTMIAVARKIVREKSLNPSPATKRRNLIQRILGL